MLGSQIGPIVWTLVIRQVVRQPLPRVIPEEMYIGVSHCYGVGRITVPSMNCLQSPVWRLSACLESGIIFNIHFIMQNPSKIPLKLKLGNSKVLQITS